MGAAALLLTACGGFLLAVLWMDLILDVQVMRHPRRTELPDSCPRRSRRTQTRLARSTFRDHVVCLGCVATFLVLRVAAA